MSSQKHTDKVSSEAEEIHAAQNESYSAFQFYYQLIYMSAVAAAGLSRNQVFDLGAKLNCVVAPYFADVQTLVSSLHYDYPRACRVVGGRCKETDVASFLLRLSDALEAGESLPGFLTHEAGVQRNVYVNEYERNLDSMRKWTDAYASLIVSMALIVIINLVSTMIYDMGNTLMMLFVGTACLFSAGGAWVVTRSTPRERLALCEGPGSGGTATYSTNGHDRTSHSAGRLTDTGVNSCWMGLGNDFYSIGKQLYPAYWHGSQNPAASAKKKNSQPLCDRWEAWPVPQEPQSLKL